MHRWGGDGEDLPVAGLGWGQYCLPESLSTVHESEHCVILSALDGHPLGLEQSTSVSYW